MMKLTYFFLNHQGRLKGRGQCVVDLPVQEVEVIIYKLDLLICTLIKQ